MEFQFQNEDKRRHPRATTRLKVRFQSTDSGAPYESEDAWLVGSTKDLSAGGINLTHTTRLKAHTILKVLLDMPGREKPLKAFAEVAWTTAKPDAEGLFDSGISFLAVKNSDHEELMVYVGGLLKEK